MYSETDAPPLTEYAEALKGKIMAENNNVIFNEQEGSVTIFDDAGKPAVFQFFDEAIIPLDDEDGKTTNFECIASMEYEDTMYYALLPEPENEDEVGDEFVVLKGEEENDELLFSSIDSDEENVRIGDLFLKALLATADMAEDDGDDGEILQ